MWYEILPSAAIVFVAMALPTYAGLGLNKLFLDNKYRRSMETKPLRMQYLRDRRLADNPYKMRGLESIPDD